MQEEEYTIPQMVDDVRAGKMPRRQFIKTLSVMGISAAGIGAISTAAARSFTTTPGNQEKLDKAVGAEKLTQLHDQHLEHQSQGNIDALQHDYAHNAVVEDNMYRDPLVGRNAIMGRKNVGFAAIPDLKITVTNRVVHGQQVSVEWVASGTHSGDFPGLPASGRSFSINGVTVVVRKDGKIVRESLYYDMAEVHRQLGMK